MNLTNWTENYAVGSFESIKLFFIKYFQSPVPWTWANSAAFWRLTRGRVWRFLLADGAVVVLAGDVYDAVLTVDDDEDEAVEFSSSNCCTCRISTYSSRFCDADDVDEAAAAAEINEEFGRLPLNDD